MKTLVIGLKISGTAAASFLLSQGKEVIGVDSDPALVFSKKSFPAFLDTDPIDFLEIDQVIVSPGISRQHPLYQKAVSLGINVIGETELGLQNVHQPCLGITGTNGKTTVTLLVEHLLNSAGIAARSLGNMGTPLTSYCLSPNVDEVLVIELSSYQLETMTSPVLDGGVILNITPDHLDRYSTMQEYAKAKCRIQDCLKQGKYLHVHREVYDQYSSFFKRREVVCFNEEIFFWKKEDKFSKLDKENALAAWGLVKPFGITEEQFFYALDSFKKPPHRIEFVAEIDGISYYDDSKGTNVDAVFRAVETMQGSVILIAGGVDKGGAYDSWNRFCSKVKKIFVFGQAADKIENELTNNFLIEKVDSLKMAVEKAACFAKSGDAVLLSPGCSSFDMFRDYVHRGQEFKQCVLDLQERRIER